MFEKVLFRSLAAVAFSAALLATTAHAAMIRHDTTTIDMDFVTVGNPGNANDTYGDGYGGVGYAYRIGKYEVMADQWAAVIAADSDVGNAGSWSGSQPTAGTSWYEAAKFCNWLTSGSAATGVYSFTGLITSPTGVTIDRATAQSTYGTAYFIPTEDEWYKAAYYAPNKLGGAGYYDYPTGSDAEPDGIDFDGDTVFDAVFRQGYIQGSPNDVTNAGIASPYGTIGQGGNVWEWNEALISSSRGLRGGSWWDSSFYFAASTGGDGHDPADELFLIGFRVASSEAVPEPASIAVWLGVGAIALVWRRRRR